MSITEGPTETCECGQAFHFPTNLSAHRQVCQWPALVERAKRHAEERDHYREEVQKLNLQIDEYLKAFSEISQMGAVCREFETCDHKVCSDSSGAALLAMDILNKSGRFSKETKTEKRKDQTQFVCNKCGYCGPVQYPHYRFRDPETTEFCAYYAAPIGKEWAICGWCAGGQDDPQGTCPKCGGAKGKWIEKT